MRRKLTNYNILKDLLKNACIKGKDSLNLTEEQIETALGETKENIYEVVGDVSND